MENLNRDTPISELMHALVDDDTSGLLDDGINEPTVTADSLAEDGQSVNEVLTHWGIKGMRWGVRRYQKKDGSLTKAGKRRKAKLEEELKQLKGPKKRGPDGKFVSEKPTAEVRKTPKSIAEMDDNELRQYINRKAMERDAITVNSQLAALNPPKVSKGKEFMSSMSKSIVAPIVINAAKDVGTKYLSKTLSKKLGLDVGDGLGELEKAAKKANLEAQISNAKTAYEKAKFQENITRDSIDKSNRERAERAAKESDIWKRDSSYTPPKRDPEPYSKRSSDLHNYGLDVVTDSHSTPVSSVSKGGYLTAGKSAVSGYLSAPVAGYLPAPKDDD